MDEIKKDSNDLNWFDDICKWADKYDLNHEDFPRDKTLLENMIQLEICNNNIEEIPPQIKYLTKLLVIMACDNNIKEIPKEIFNLKSLCMVTFTNNKISVIPDEIEKLSLMFLRISNNPLEIIPQSLYRKKRLNSLYLHNTKLHAISDDIFQLKNLSKLTFDDKHLPFIAKNIHLLPNINTINLRESNYTEISEIIQNLGLKFDIKKWIEKEHKLDNGSIMLSKENKDDYDVEKHVKDLLDYALEIVASNPYKALELFYEADSLCKQERVFPNEMIDLSMEIVLNIADLEIEQAIKLLDIINIKYFRIETIDKLVLKVTDERYKMMLEDIKEVQV